MQTNNTIEDIALLHIRNGLCYDSVVCLIDDIIAFYDEIINIDEYILFRNHKLRYEDDDNYRGYFDKAEHLTLLCNFLSYFNIRLHNNSTL